MPREIQRMALAVLIFSEGFGAHCTRFILYKATTCSLASDRKKGSIMATLWANKSFKMITW